MADLGDLAGELAFAIARLARQVQFRDLPGLTASEMAVLSGLEAGVTSPTGLAAREKMREPSITRHLRSLEGKGLITAEGDPKDRRRSVITLTDAGHQALATARGGFWLEAAVRKLPESEQRVLRDVLPVLAKLAAG